jgi:hypothetical protein
MRVYACPHLRRSRLFALPHARDFALTDNGLGRLLLGLALGSCCCALPEEGYKEN